MIIVLLTVLFSFKNCFCEDNNVNDAEYNSFPALFALEEYHPCLRDGGLYCLARFDLYSNAFNRLTQNIHIYSSDVKHYNRTNIERGVCVSKSCGKFFKNQNLNTTAILPHLLEQCQNETIWKHYKIEAKLSQIYYCDRNEGDEDTDAADKTVLKILLAILIVNIIGSCYDVFIYRTNSDFEGGRFLLIFSIFQNIKTLFSWNNNDERISQLRGLHGIRSLTQLGVVFAHSTLLIGAGFTENPHDYEKMFDISFLYILFNGLMIVQIYFVISGCLLVYTLEINAETKPTSWTNIPIIIFRRWWRLTPVSAVVIAYTATWLRHAGSGPLWKYYVTSGTVHDCRQYWWLHMLYVNNLVPDDKLCVLQTWYTAVQMQLLIIGLVVYMATRSRGRIVCLLLLVVFGIMATASHLWTDDLDTAILLSPEFYRSCTDIIFNTVHVRPHINLSSFAIGMCTGQLVYSFQRKGVDLSQYKILRKLTWFILPGIVTLLMSGQAFYSNTTQNVLVRAIYGSMHRATMGWLAAFLILSLVFKLNDVICKFLEWRGWAVFDRLSYSLYLVHMIFIHLLLGVREQVVKISYFYWIYTYLEVLAASIAAAFMLYILVEVPMLRLIKSFTQEQNSRETKKLQ